MRQLKNPVTQSVIGDSFEPDWLRAGKRLKCHNRVWPRSVGFRGSRWERGTADPTAANLFMWSATLDLRLTVDEDGAHDERRI